MPHLNEKRYKMITLQLEIDIAEDRCLTIQLPENCQTGKHQVVLVLNPEDTSVEKASTDLEKSEAFQAFLESVAERKEVYQRLADA